jgi:hypothetical protein
MIRIVDDPIYSFTRAEYDALRLEYDSTEAWQYNPRPFEDWLHFVKKRQYTTYREEHP